MTLAVLSLCLLISNSCSSSEKQNWSPLIYAGDSKRMAVARDEGKEIVACKDKKFDEMFCVFERDMYTMLKKCLEEDAEVNTMDWFSGQDK